MRKIIILSAVVAFAAACASVSETRIEDSLEEIGIPADKASCIADQARDRLNRRDLQDLADFLSDLTRAGRRGEGLDIVLEIDNPAVVGALTASAISCAFAPTGR